MFKDKAEKIASVLDPAFAARQWSPLDAGPAARMRDVQRAYEQIRVTEALLVEQQETNRLLRKLAGE